MKSLVELVESNQKGLDGGQEEKKDLMSNLKKLEMMMKQISKHKETSDEERLKDIDILKNHENDLFEVKKDFLLIFVL
jgi:hypothetical protein